MANSLLPSESEVLMRRKRAPMQLDTFDLTRNPMQVDTLDLTRKPMQIAPLDLSTRTTAPVDISPLGGQLIAATSPLVAQATARAAAFRATRNAETRKWIDAFNAAEERKSAQYAANNASPPLVLAGARPAPSIYQQQAGSATTDTAQDILNRQKNVVSQFGAQQGLLSPPSATAAAPAQATPADAPAADDPYTAAVMKSWLGEQQSPIIADQIAQAQALQQRNYGVLPNSPWGTALSGLANVVDEGRGAYQEKKLRGQQQQNLALQQEGNKPFAQLLAQQFLQSQALRKDAALQAPPLVLAPPTIRGKVGNGFSDALEG